MQAAEPITIPPSEYRTHKVRKPWVSLKLMTERHQHRSGTRPGGALALGGAHHLCRGARRLGAPGLALAVEA